MIAGNHTPQSIGGALGLLVVAVVAHSCALQLIDVRPYAMFQHYHPWQWIVAERPLAIWGVLGQILTVTVVAWRLRPRLRQAIAGILSARAWLLIIAVAGISLAVPTEGVPRTLGELVLAGGLAIVAALNLLLAVLLLPDPAMARAAAWVDSRVSFNPGSTGTRRWDGRIPFAVALWIAILTAAVSYLVLERVPHIDDSISNYFQARYFAAGHLYLPAPPDAQSFRIDQTIVESGKWYGYAFPAWPAVLAIGVLLNVPWLVNPILAGVLILVGHAFVRRRIDRGTANAAVLMLAVSPWLLFMSAEFMVHPLTGVLVLFAALAFDRATANESKWTTWAAAGGLATGVLMLTRAIDGVIVIAALGATILIERRLRRAWPALVLAGGMAVAVAALIFPYNKAVTGRADYAPHMAWSDGRWGPGVDRLGFGADVGIRAWPNLDPLPGHGVADVVLNINKNAFMTNIELFGWASGSLILVWLAFGLGQWRRGDVLFLVLSMAFIVGYSAYWFSGGPDLGARYWYPLLVPLAALSARGAQMLSVQLQARGVLSFPGARIGAFIVAASVSAAITTVPWRAMTKHYRYRGISAEIRELADAHQFKHALVFVRAEENRRDYAAAFNFNPRTLEDPATIYAFDAGPSHRAAVVAHFPDREVWVVGRARAGGTGGAPLDVIAGPLAPGTVPK